MQSNLGVRSQFDPHTGSPMVVFQWGGMSGDMLPGMAREFALNVLACANAAEQDAFLFEFLTGNGVEPDHALKTINEFGKRRMRS